MLAENPCVGGWSGGAVVHLRVEADGHYRAFLAPSGGGSIGYCLNVVGNGASRGTWRPDGESARIEVEREEPDLAMSLRGASLERDGEALWLVLDRESLRLERGDF